jgi:hypothetical protein
MYGVSGLAVFGAVTGGLGLTLSVLNFLRDGARLQIKLTWGMELVGGPGGSKGLVIVHNVGRRPVYVSHTHLTGTSDRSMQLIMGGIDGVTLGEGAPPRQVIINQDAKLEADLGGHWWRVRAAVVDGAGRKHYSPWPLERPTFASKEPPPLFLLLARGLNWWHRVRPW